VDEAYLRANSKLPGPRANLELLGRAAEEVDKERALAWAGREVGADPADVFVIMVGLVGLGRLAAEGDEGGLALLRRRAQDENWRVREGVAIGLQRLGDDRPERLFEMAREWSTGSALEARAAVAAVAEPRLLKTSTAVATGLDVLDEATQRVVESHNRVLRQALGYGWSVVVAADPARGLPRFEAWEARAGGDPDLAWIVRENRSKSRMQKLDR
jgi:hypothetical protein